MIKLLSLAVALFALGTPTEALPLSGRGGAGHSGFQGGGFKGERFHGGRFPHRGPPQGYFFGWGNDYSGPPTVNVEVNVTNTVTPPPTAIAPLPLPTRTHALPSGETTAGRRRCETRSHVVESAEVKVHRC